MANFIRPANIGAAMQRGRDRVAQNRLNQLGIQKAEMGVQAELDENQVMESVGDAVRIKNTAPERRREAILAVGDKLVGQGREADAREILKILEFPPELQDEMLVGTVDAAAAQYGFTSPFSQEAAPRDDRPAAIREFEFVKSLNPEDRELYNKVQRGYKPTPEEEIRLQEKKAEAAQIGTAKGEAAAGDIPGSKANLAKLEAEGKALDAAATEDAKARMAGRYSGIVFEDIGNAIEMVEQNPTFTTGLVGGQLLKNLGGTPANNLMSTLETIEAGIAFDRLQAMRDASATGGALGQVSEMEIGLLKAALGSIRQSQSAPQLLKRLKRMQDIYREIVDGVAPEEAEPQRVGRFEIRVK